MEKEFKNQILEYGKLLATLGQFNQEISEHLADEKEKKHYSNKAKECFTAARKIEEAKTDEQLLKVVNHIGSI